MAKDINIFLSVLTSGSTKNDEIMNMALNDDEGNILYIERTDFFLDKINNNPVNLKIMDFQRMNYTEVFQEQTKIETTGATITKYKDRDNAISAKIKTYLNDLSDNGENTIYFWVDNPLSWFFFVGLTFPDENNIVYIPEFVNPYPMDINTLFMFTLDKRSIEDYYPNLPDEAEFNSLYRSQYLQEIVSKIFFQNMSSVIKNISEGGDDDGDSTDQ